MEPTHSIELAPPHLRPDTLGVGTDVADRVICFGSKPLDSHASMLDGQMASPNGSETDGELYKLAVSGDRAATQVLVGRYHADLVLYIKAKTNAHAVAEDAAAEAWLRFFRHVNEVAEDPSRALNKPESFRFWLYRIALNAMRTQFRSASRQAELSGRATSEAQARGMTSFQPDELAALENEERRSAIRDAFTKLGEACRELLTLMSSDPPLSYKEIAELTGRPIGSLGPTRKRCLDDLRQHLGAMA